MKENPLEVDVEEGEGGVLVWRCMGELLLELVRGRLSWRLLLLGPKGRGGKLGRWWVFTLLLEPREDCLVSGAGIGIFDVGGLDGESVVTPGMAEPAAEAGSLEAERERESMRFMDIE
jgi:hypothetical protein